MIILYLLGMFVGVLVSLLLKKTLFKGEAVPFVMELPNYRLPTFKNTTLLLWEKAKDFLQRAFTIIFLATIVIWFLQSFDVHFNLVEDSKDSILATISGFMEPIFKPIGLGDWRICTSLITGFIAKESVVSTINILFGPQAITSVLSCVSAMSLLVFCLLYTPCVAAISSIKRELGVKWAITVVLWQCVIAWLCSFVVYFVGNLL
jgi:ferrous iron transport protein B